ncbi:hypothetical protein JAAARDRAFT_200104 [Jaapia argillacea MUCL 33604]|uniref:F-box domain-containing protein n=1 Tax=Jaapia argillacea MUCL 33604 TaxID=933084 RepID=A0A067P6B1_9AGAM|nr:hypothetical protein JAAARDRAFT_200104 [Jaapia argillacea MUCL 33604]
MQHLPLELLREIVSLSPPSTLAALRGTNKGLHDLITLSLFRVIKLKDTVQCATSLEVISQNKQVSELVEEIWLEVVTVEGKNIHWRRALQAAIFMAGAIGANPPHTIRTLILENLSALPNNEVYDTQGLCDVLGSLEVLVLGVVSDNKLSEGGFLIDTLRDFWECTVSKQLLPPTQANLASLTIKSDQEVGCVPNIYLSTLCFPNLTSLSLENVLFGEMEADRFIFKHGTTLTHIVLHTCPYILPEDYHEVSDNPSFFWSTFFRRVVTDCPVLTSLTLLNGYGHNHRGLELHRKLHYSYCDTDCGYILIEEDLVGAWDDMRALENLMQVLESRRMGQDEETGH